jgi:hypothetical protein
MILTEGIHDKGTFKVVFMAGGSGSGKDFVMNKTIKGLPLVEINSDTMFEFLLKKNNIKPSEIDREDLQDTTKTLRDAAKRSTQTKLKHAFDNRLGLIINGTGGDFDKIKKMKDEFESLGYKTSMLFVSVANETSKKRNELRGQNGGRKVKEAVRFEKWNEAMQNKDKYKSLFGHDFTDFNADRDAINGTPEEKAEAAKDQIATFRKMHAFINSPIDNPEAKQWYHYQLTTQRTNQGKAPLDIAKFFQSNKHIRTAKDQESHEYMKKLKSKYKKPEQEPQYTFASHDNINWQQLSNQSLGQYVREGNRAAMMEKRRRELTTQAYK